MKHWPRTLLARTFLLTATLLLLTTSSLLVLFKLSLAEPRARETAQLASSSVNLVRAALLASAAEKRPDLFAELGSREGMRLLPAESADQLEPLPDDRYFRFVRREIDLRLGAQTRLGMAVNGVPGFWVSFRLDDDDDEDYWVILPSEHAEFVQPWHWLAWGALISLLSLVLAWFSASGLSRPLARLAQAAGMIGRRQMPSPLPETGAAEVEQLARAFNRMASDLAHYEQERAEVLAGISHDLRTPLTRLRLEAEMSIADTQARAGVVADIEQMESIIAQFLDYARGESSEPAELVEPESWLREIAARLGRPDRRLECAIAPLPACRVHPKALFRALSNLIENAFKYGSPEVDLNAYTVGDRLCIEVLDRGPGIPEAERERAKQPFIRLDSARGNANGTGLGLAIVDRVARLHGGQLVLEDREGGGLLARLSLPINR